MTDNLQETPFGPSAMDRRIEELYTQGKGRDWQPLSEDNWEEEIKSIPLFMKSMPRTQEDVEENPTLAAIQSLIYDGTPEGEGDADDLEWTHPLIPVEIATNFKNQGNEVYQERIKAKYPAAVSYYTKALEQRCGNQQLETICLLNRAMVNLDLGI